ncbi:hypothetical protein MUU46_20325 [Scandinavium sp. TWS1a]|uniref:hypothetical protein n=1 Tax=Scandinavium tedordense TaxID=2926521 RepID=UPI002165A5EA|nr:hypothetical protein [Scandinavium tedordense]MCS2172633.1 hypothetical protein [Scandinavium tedordense]
MIVLALSVSAAPAHADKATATALCTGEVLGVMKRVAVRHGGSPEKLDMTPEKMLPGMMQVFGANYDLGAGTRAAGLP